LKYYFEIQILELKNTLILAILINFDRYKQKKTKFNLVVENVGHKSYPLLVSVQNLVLP
jgi:hypothetical protein